MLSRRQLLGGAAGLLALAGCSDQDLSRPGESAGASPGQRSTEAYGRGDRQYGEWTFPAAGTAAAGALPVVMLVHGGYWRADFGPDLERRIATALGLRGFAVWTIDYRASDTAWPATLVDAAAALDHLQASRYADRLDLDRVAVVGHSAGGQLALWLGSRSRIPPEAPGATAAPDAARVRVRLAIGQAPVADLVAGARLELGGGAVQALLDGEPGQVPDRYAAASPLALLPPDDGATVHLVHGDADEVVPLSQSRAYASAARRAGVTAELTVVKSAGHFEHLDPASTALDPVWAALRTL